MNAIGTSILVILILVVLSAPRRGALLAVMIGVLYLTQGQGLQILGLNLYAVRFIELAGFIRVMARREFTFSKLNGIDRTFLLLFAYTLIVFLLRSKEGQAYQIGLAVDALLCYLTFRGLLKDLEDLKWFLHALVILLVPYVGLLMVESLTRQNPFTAIGGVAETVSFVRGDRYRCFGSFRHPSLLGTLGASFIPLYIGLALERAGRKLAFLGIVLCLLIVWASNSGGPASSTAVAVVGWLFWRMRARMRLVRRGLVWGIVVLALVMKAPIWYLPARVSSFSGGDGWHRSHLMDMAFQNLGKWGFAGMPLSETGDWFAYTLSTGSADMTNQYLAFGMAAGLGAIALFIVLFVMAFRSLGRALAVVRSVDERPTETEFLLWGLGVMLLVHSVNFLGITYFDQTYAIWYLQLAAISGLTQHVVHAAAVGKRSPADSPDAIFSRSEDGHLALSDRCLVPFHVRGTYLSRQI